MTMREAIEQDRERQFAAAAEAVPALADPNSRTRQVAEEIYQEKYSHLVEQGKMQYGDALAGVIADAERKIGFEEIKEARTTRTFGKIPQFLTKAHSSQTGKTTW